MSCIGKEVVEYDTQQETINVVNSRDIVIDNFVLHTFDIMTMKSEDMDFTMTFGLKPNRVRENALSDSQKELLKEKCIKTTICNDFEDLSSSRIHWCHEVVLRFEMSFTSRVLE